jgi:hypothetical protein
MADHQQLELVSSPLVQGGGSSGGNQLCKTISGTSLEFKVVANISSPTCK